jgi:hypothetical protein
MNGSTQKYKQRAWRTAHQETKLHDAHHKLQSIEKSPLPELSAGFEDIPSRAFSLVLIGAMKGLYKAFENL